MATLPTSSTPAALNGGLMNALKPPPVAASVRTNTTLVFPLSLKPTASPWYAPTIPVDNGKLRVVSDSVPVEPSPIRGMPAAASTSWTPAGLLYARSLIVATTPSSTIFRAQSTSPFASPLVSQTTPCILLPPVPSPPRLLNAATAALNASPWSGFAAVGDVIGAIIPILTIGPAAAALRTEALAD